MRGGPDLYLGVHRINLDSHLKHAGMTELGGSNLNEHCPRERFLD